MFPMNCIMGAVVLSVTRWYPQQLFVFMGSIFQRSHLWQLTLRTKASCLGDGTIVMGHCCCKYRSYRSIYSGTSFHFQLQIKGWTHVVSIFHPSRWWVFCTCWWLQGLGIKLWWYFWDNFMSSGCRVPTGSKKAERNLCCAPSYPSITSWNTHLHCSSLVEILWSISKEIPSFFLVQTWRPLKPGSHCCSAW